MVFLLVGPVLPAGEECEAPLLLPDLSFQELASLPSRLTMYNRHDDAARATYTCCKPEQKEQIEQALRANESFLTLFPNSDYADDTLIHNARIYSVARNFRKEFESLMLLVQRYPDSDLADDGLWRLAEMYRQDAAHGPQLETLWTLVRNYPRSTYADDALFHIAQRLTQERDEQGAIAALEELVRRYPLSDFCDDALFSVAQRYQALGNHEAALHAYQTLQNLYPYSNFYDDSQLQIGNCLRALHDQEAAVEAYRALIHNGFGSPLVRQAAQEVNNILPESYDLSVDLPSDFEEEAFNTAMHYVRFREYSHAVSLLKQFIRQFPGNDRCDEAMFQIGRCYREMNELMSKIDQAQGPEEVFRLQPEWEAAVGKRATVPVRQGLQTGSDAVSAYSFIVTRLYGSDLRDDALYEIAKCYEDVKKDAYAGRAFQQLLTLFPGSPYETEALHKMLAYLADPQYYPESLKDYG